MGAWKPGTLLSEIKYRKGDVWGPNQMCEFQTDSMQTKHNEVTQCLTHTAENVKAADQLCRETKSNQQVPINRTICYLDYKQSDPCNPEVCNGTFKNSKISKIQKCSKMCHYILDCNYRQ